MSEEEHVKVGVGVMILKGDSVLLGKRQGSHGEGDWSFPGGHLEYKESFTDCALREIEEECGVKVKNISFQLLSNTSEYLPKYYVHVGLLAHWESGEPEVREPEKCLEWKWFPLSGLPEPMFMLSKRSIDAYNQGINFWEEK